MTLQIKKREYKTKLPYKVRCVMARFERLQVDEFAAISGIMKIQQRPMLRRIFNELVSQGFARKIVNDDGSRTYESIPEQESRSIKRFAGLKEKVYYDNKVSRKIDIDSIYKTLNEIKNKKCLIDEKPTKNKSGFCCKDCREIWFSQYETNPTKRELEASWRNLQ